MFMEDPKYNIALAILNNVVGERFQALQEAQHVSVVNSVQVKKLKEEFQQSFSARDNLRHATAAELKRIIDETGPQVKARIASFHPDHLQPG
jgi:hypothetical protein